MGSNSLTRGGVEVCGFRELKRDRSEERLKKAGKGSKLGKGAGLALKWAGSDYREGWDSHFRGNWMRRITAKPVSRSKTRSLYISCPSRVSQH